MTRTLIIAYELSQPSESRTQLAELLMSIGEAWARPLDTVWMLRTKLSPEAVEGRLSPLLGDDEGLMVQEARGEASFANTGLRWFRPRRSTAMEALEMAAVIAFPEATAGSRDQLNRAA